MANPIPPSAPRVNYPDQVNRDLAALGIKPDSLGDPQDFYAGEAAIDHIRPAETADGQNVFVKIKVSPGHAGSYTVGGQTYQYKTGASSAVGVYLPPDKDAPVRQPDLAGLPPTAPRQDAILRGQVKEIDRNRNGDTRYTLRDNRPEGVGDFAQVNTHTNGSTTYELHFGGIGGAHLQNLSAENLPLPLINMKNAAEAKGRGKPGR